MTVTDKENLVSVSKDYLRYVSHLIRLTLMQSFALMMENESELISGMLLLLLVSRIESKTAFLSPWLHQTSSIDLTGGSLTWSYDVNNTDKTAEVLCLQSSQHTINGSF